MEVVEERPCRETEVLRAESSEVEEGKRCGKSQGS